MHDASCFNALFLYDFLKVKIIYPLNSTNVAMPVSFFKSPILVYFSLLNILPLEMDNFLKMIVPCKSLFLCGYISKKCPYF